MGNYISADYTRKRTRSEANLDAEVGDDEGVRSVKKYVLRMFFEVIRVQSWQFPSFLFCCH